MMTGTFVLFFHHYFGVYFMSLSPDFLSYFSDLEDPRVSDRNRRHRLDDLRLRF